jgi:predicted ribosome quality control (RQC) complex YloA/Tae2 family protein
MSKILEKFYEKRDISDRISQKSSSIKKIIETKMERSRNKLLKQKKELVEAQKRDIYKIYADLISANIYKIDKGIKEINLENFYDENSEVISIPLDVKLSPSQNAQKYYKKYAKLKNAAKLLDQQIPQTEEEISYLENVMIGIENCTDITELDEIKEELFNEGYIKSNPRNKKKKETIVSKPYHFISSDGIDIFVGKNNKQNDYLTLKFANREDLWLHGKNIPGSHVIIRFNENIPETTIIEGATLAAYFSRGKNSQNVSVDYTLKKYVKKPKGSKPGMVIYENYKTIYVNPDKDIIEKMKRAE